MSNNSKLTLNKNGILNLKIFLAILSIGSFYYTGYQIGKIIPMFNTLKAFDKFSCIFGIIIELMGAVSFLILFAKPSLLNFTFNKETK